MVCIGHGVLDDAGQVVTVWGYFVDITPGDRSAAATQVQQAVDASAETRADIEQAKGALMLVQGMSAEEAFRLLEWHSQHANIKLRVLARTITERMSERIADESAEQRISRALAEAVLR